MKFFLKIIVISFFLALITGSNKSYAVTFVSDDFEIWPPVGWTIANHSGDCVWASSETTGIGGNNNKYLSIGNFP